MPEPERLKPGLTAERTVAVEEKMTVSHTGRPVLSTPMMISLMESVANDLVQPLLPAGMVTVGYEVHVKHKAPAFPGEGVRVSAELLEVNGRRLLFEVRVLQGDRPIGEGRHRRTIIQAAGQGS
jgi:fluoroacetyl-CoA thioesterase